MSLGPKLSFSAPRSQFCSHADKRRGRGQLKWHWGRMGRAHPFIFRSRCHLAKGLTGSPGALGKFILGASGVPPVVSSHNFLKTMLPHAIQTLRLYLTHACNKYTNGHSNPRTLEAVECFLRSLYTNTAIHQLHQYIKPPMHQQGTKSDTLGASKPTLGHRTG